jgi:hypothetical protein
MEPDTLPKQIDALRGQIEQAKAALAAAEVAPVSMDEAVTRFREYLDELAAPLSASEFARILFGAAPLDPMSRALLLPPQEPGLRALVVALLRDRLEAWGLDALKRHQPPGSVTPNARATEVSRLRDEVHRLEVAEEIAILQAEGAGLDIERREDCNVDVFLSTFPPDGDAAV